MSDPSRMELHHEKIEGTVNIRGSPISSDTRYLSGNFASSKVGLCCFKNSKKFHPRFFDCSKYVFNGTNTLVNQRKHNVPPGQTNLFDHIQSVLVEDYAILARNPQ